MSEEDQPLPRITLAEVVAKVDLYPIEAFQFVQQGLAYTAELIHAQQTDTDASRHITGQQLCAGLRDFALMKWGLLARTVLNRWNVHATFDFGRIVFAMVDNGLMQKTEDDTVEDFRGVYDFKTAFEGYTIPPQPEPSAKEGRS